MTHLHPLLPCKVSTALEQSERAYRKETEGRQATPGYRVHDHAFLDLENLHHFIFIHTSALSSHSEVSLMEVLLKVFRKKHTVGGICLQSKPLGGAGRRNLSPS